MAPSVTGHVHMAEVVETDHAAAESYVTSLTGFHEPAIGVAADWARRDATRSRGCRPARVAGMCDGVAG